MISAHWLLNMARLCGSWISADRLIGASCIRTVYCKHAPASFLMRGRFFHVLNVSLRVYERLIAYERLTASLRLQKILQTECIYPSVVLREELLSGENHEKLLYGTRVKITKIRQNLSTYGGIVERASRFRRHNVLCFSPLQSCDLVIRIEGIKACGQAISPCLLYNHWAVIWFEFKRCREARGDVRADDRAHAHGARTKSQ